jgi:hypothetical protein
MAISIAAIEATWGFSGASATPVKKMSDKNAVAGL